MHHKTSMLTYKQWPYLFTMHAKHAAYISVAGAWNVYDTVVRCFG